MATIKVKTIDISAKEWTDKKFGNSYFSGIVTVNYGMENEKVIHLPFQYGYGDHYTTVAQNELVKLGFMSDSHLHIANYCREHSIIYRANIQRSCLLRDVKNLIRNSF